MWLETANSYVSAHWLNISQLPNIGALANTLPLVLEQPASGKQPAGLILYFQLHNLLVAQTGWLAGYRPSGVFLQAANIARWLDTASAAHGITFYHEQEQVICGATIFGAAYAALTGCRLL